MATGQRFKIELEKFEHAAFEIQEGYLARKGRKGLAPFDTAESFFKREAYSLLYQVEPARLHRIVTHILTRNSRIPRKGTYKENRFHWGLLAIDPDGVCLDEGGRKVFRYARELHFARRNGVPATYLIGFLHQIGGVRRIPRSLSEVKKGHPSLFMEVRMGGGS